MINLLRTERSSDLENKNCEVSSTVIWSRICTDVTRPSLVQRQIIASFFARYIRNGRG